MLKPCAWVLAALVLCHANLAAAQTEPRVVPECAATGADAATLFRRGQELYAQNDYPGSYYCYRRSWETSPNFDVAANLGNLELKLNHFADAADHLTYARDHLPASLAEPTRSETLKGINERLASVLARVAAVRVTVTPAGALVAVDGREVGRAPLERPVFVDPGPHQLVVSLQGYRDDPRPFTAVAGTTLDLSVALAVKRSGLAKARTPLVILGTALAIAAAGAGVGLIIGSVVVDGDREDALAALQSSRPGNPCVAGTLLVDECTDIADDAELAQTLLGVGIGLLGAGVVFGAGTLTFGLVTSGDAPPPTTGVRLRVGPTGALLEGSF
jgi:hypothetical protein